MLDATGARPLIDRDAADGPGPRRLRRDGRRRALRQGRLHPMTPDVRRHRRRVRHRRAVAAASCATAGTGWCCRSRVSGARRRPARRTSRSADRSSPTWPTRPVRAVAGRGRGAARLRAARRRGRRARPGRRARRSTSCASSSTSTSVARPLLTRDPARRTPGPRGGRVRELLGRAHRPPVLVGVRRDQVRAAGARRLAARRGGRARRPGHHRLPEPDRHRDAGEGPRPGGQGPTTPRSGSAGDGGRHDPRRARPDAEDDVPVPDLSIKPR